MTRFAAWDDCETSDDDRGPDDIEYAPGPWRCMNCKQMVECHPDDHECTQGQESSE